MPEDLKTELIAVTRLEEERLSALIHADLSTIERLYHRDMIHIHSSARIEDRNDFIESVKTGRVKFAFFGSSNTRTRIYEGVALITGNITTQVEVQGHPRTVRAIFSSTWIKDGDNWRFLSWQSTPVPA